MALRVLLADESTTIKKVMQLALQDFAVEVKAVPIGLDVLPVTKNFKPDIIFVDVLLTKKSGYDVCAELKNDSETQHLPIVLMWSSFMELDEAKFQSCRANGRLEKPFDADSLRQLVEKLAVKTQSQPVSAFLDFPPLPSFEEAQEEVPAAPSVTMPEAPIYVAPPSSSVDAPLRTPPPPPPPPTKKLEPTNINADLNIDLDHDPINLDEIPMIESIDDVDMPPLAPAVNAPTLSISPLAAGHAAVEEAHNSSFNSSQVDDEDEGWTRQDLTKFKINIPTTESEDFASKFVIPQDDLVEVAISGSENFEELTFAESQKNSHKPQTQSSFKNAGPSLSQSTASIQGNFVDKEAVERIIREEARAAIEAIAWRLLPEITERVVREEISKLLRDTENSL